MNTILLLLINVIVGLVVVQCFQRPVARNQRAFTKIFSNDEQTVQDLNLDQMFEVFETADQTVPASAIPKGQPGSVFNPKDSFGSSLPFGFFDPAGLSLDVSEEQFKLYQEAEYKHGRVAMLAFLGLFFGESGLGFLFNGQVNGEAIYQWQQADAMFPLSKVALALIGVVEVLTIKAAWQPLDETLKEPLGLAKLSKTHVPGQYNFDPLGFKPKNPNELKEMKLKELNNGRLAMLGVAGFVAQELITDSKIF